MSEALPDPFDVPCGRPARGVVTAPPSKSHAIRLLIAAALAEGTTRVTDVPANEDVAAVVDGLRALGIRVRGAGGELVVTGCAGRLPADTARLDVRGSGTGLRLLTAVCCLGPGPYVLDGDASLRARPLGGVEDLVRRLGCTIETSDGRAPLTVRGGPPAACPAEGLVVDGSRSSQPVSAALLVAAALPGAAVVRVPGPLVSSGYVELTASVLTEFDCRVDSGTDDRGAYFDLRGDALTSPELAAVSGDWSSAAFLLGAAAASGGVVSVRDVDPSWRDEQPDAAVLEILERMGALVEVDEAPMWAGTDIETMAVDAVRCSGVALRGVEADLGGSPDLAPLVGALGCVADGATVVTGAPHLRIKESDRIASTVAAARAIGCEAEERPDGFVIHGGGGTGGTVDPRGDHRIAMAFAVAGLAIPGVRIRDPGCVAKSYPGFWADLARLTGEG